MININNLDGSLQQKTNDPDLIVNVHPQMTVLLASTSYENDASADFTFTLSSGTGDGAIFEEHYEVVLTIPEEISSCEIATLVTSSPLLTDLTKDSRDETEYYFFIELDNASSTRFIEPERADTTPVDSIEFKLTCINPPSLEPISSFSVHLLDLDSNTVTYGEYENYATQTASPFSVKSLVLEHEYPRVEAEYTFSITPNTEVFDSIIVSMTGAVVGETPSCSIISGLTGTIACAFNGNDVVITGIGSASETEASFSIDSYTNPADTTLFTATITTYTGGYLIQEGDLNYEMPCNYPCQSCDDSYPDQCTQCFQSDEYVFSPQEMFLQTETKTCIESCADKYYEDGTNCNPCVAPCENCSASDVCITCPDSGTIYFYEELCYFECPEFTFPADDDVCYTGFSTDFAISDRTYDEPATYSFAFDFTDPINTDQTIEFEFHSTLTLSTDPQNYDNSLFAFYSVSAHVVSFTVPSQISAGECVPIFFSNIPNPVIFIIILFFTSHHLLNMKLKSKFTLQTPI